MALSLAQFQVYFLTLSRILATIIHVPVLGGRTIPNQVKLGFGLLLALLMVPNQTLPPETNNLASIEFGFAIGKEIIIGTITGFAAVLTFGTLQIAGHMMGIGSGFGAGQILNPAIEDNGTAMDQVFVMTAFLLFFVINGHHTFLLALNQTFLLIPVNSPLPELTFNTILTMASSLIAIGVQMSLAVMGTLLLADLTLGLLARVAPQIQVFFLGLPLKIAIGMIAMALTIIALLPNLTGLFEALGPRTLEIIGK